MLLAPLLLSCLPLQDQPLPLKPEWKVGPLLRLELVRVREDWESDPLQLSRKNVTQIDVQELAKGETGWVVRWTYGHTSVIEGAEKDRDYAERMASLNEGMKLDVRLAPDGTVAGLADPEALQRHYSRMLQEVEKGLLEKNMETRVVAEMMRDMTARVLGPGFERASLVEVGLLHRCFSVPLVPGKRTDFDGELPNPFGGDPFPALGSFKLDPPDLAKKQASVHFALSVDPARTRELVLAWMTELANRSGQPPPQSADDLPLKGLEESTFYLLDLENALPRNVEHVRTTTIRKHRRIDRTFLRAVQPPAKDKPR